MEVPSILLNRLLAETAKRRAGGLHLVVGNLPTLRQDNQLVVMDGEEILTIDVLEKMISSFLTPAENEILIAKRELVTVKTFGGSFNFKIHVFYQKNLPSITFYFISETIKNIADLKMTANLADIIKSKSGLLVLAGPHFSGKTTTAVAIIEEINRTQKKHILTLEAPIEYSFISKKSLVEQRQVGRDTASLPEGLIYALGEDVDVVYVGEISHEFDQAVPLLLELATGNALVLVEINAGNSIKAVEKLLSGARLKLPEEAARYSLADALIGVISQQLFPRMGGGLVAATEVLLANSAVKSLIREGKIYQLDSVIQTSRKEGMINMEKAVEELIKSGEMKTEEV